MRNGLYHYTESGLDTVFLASGFDYQDVPGGKTVTIHDIEGLHRAIGLYLARKAQPLSGKEFRFLRTELLLSQGNLAAIMGVKELTIGRWERGESEIPRSADAVIRVLFLETIGEHTRVKTLLKRIADLEDELDRQSPRITLDQNDGEWTAQAA